MPETKKLNWTYSSFLILTPIIGIIGTYFWARSSFNWKTIALALSLFTIIQLSITAGYHRLFAHKSYKAHDLIKFIFVFFGSAAFQGPVLKWSQDHRNHHKYVDDTEKDPYSIKKGFWWAHWLWLFYRNSVLKLEKNILKDLYDDKLLRFQHKFYVPFAIIVCFILPTALAALWNDVLGGLLVAGFLRLAFNHHSTFLINSLAHTLGSQPWSEKHSSRDNLFTAILTFGEGYHNYHHEFPADYRNGTQFFDYDPTKWLIFSLNKLGLTYNLKQFNKTPKY